MSQTASSPTDCQTLKPATRWVELAERILVCARLIREELTRQTGRWQLSEPEFSLLWLCEDAPSEGVGQGELAAALAVSPSAASGYLEQLRRRGLLESCRGQSDRRRQLWRLTPSGRGHLEALLADWTARLQDRPERLDSADLLPLLDRLAGALRSRRGNPRGPTVPLLPLGPQAVPPATDCEGAA